MSKTNENVKDITSKANPKTKKEKKEYVIKDVTKQELDDVWNLVMKDNVLGNDYELLKSVLKKFPTNTDKREVALKISIIDLINSTRLSMHRNKISLLDLTNKILEIKDFDERVKEGDLNLVDELVNSISEVKLKSFVSKYCHYHNTLCYGKDDFSIFDTNVYNCLPEYAKKYLGEVISKEEMFKDYSTFRNYVDRILTNANVRGEENVRAKFDYLIWYYNRKH